MDKPSKIEEKPDIMQISLPFDLSTKLSAYALNQMNTRDMNIQTRKKRGVITAIRSIEKTGVEERIVIFIEEKTDHCVIQPVVSLKDPKPDTSYKKSSSIKLFETYLRLLVFKTIAQYRDQITETNFEKKFEDPYSVLEVSKDASRGDIQAAYRKMVKQYHPDQVANLAIEFRELAEKRMKTINLAYKQLLKNHS